MKDKCMSSKGKKNNKSNWSNRNNRNKKSNWSKGNKKFNRFIPTQEQRVDPELIQEISVFISISPDIPDETICRHYHITERQLAYIKKHQQKWSILDSLTGKELK